MNTTPYRTFIALVRAPHYSIRHPEAYQSGVAFPLPQPSTLVGALACAAALAGEGPAGLSGDEYVKRLAGHICSRLVRAVARPLSFLACSPITLSRMRVLERKGKGEDKGRISDAMVREYYNGLLSLVYVFRGDVDARKVCAWLHLLGRLGDTESLISIERVGEAAMESLGSEGYVDTYTPVEWLESYGEGEFSLMRMCKEEMAATVTRGPRDYKKHSLVYLVPLAERRMGRGLVALQESRVRVKVRRGYSIWRVEGAGATANVVLPERGEAR